MKCKSKPLDKGRDGWLYSSVGCYALYRVCVSELI